jgi:hypothetical protein
MVRQIHLRQERAQRTREQEGKAIELRELLRQQSDEDFWEEHENGIEGKMEKWEYNVRMDERARRKLKQQQRLQLRTSDEEIMSEPLSTGQEITQEDITGWQAQRLSSRDSLRQMLQ